MPVYGNMPGAYNPSREQITVALFTKLKTIGSVFITYERKLRLFSDVPAEQQPYLGLVEHLETSTPNLRGTPDKAILNFRVFIYAKAGEGVIGSTVLNNLLDAVDRALIPEDVRMNVCTLNGLVNRCWINGNIPKDPGDLDGQAMMIVPIQVLIP